MSMIVSRRPCPKCPIGVLKPSRTFVRDGERKVLIACTNCHYTEIANAEPESLPAPDEGPE
jgi:predicted nucleic-acid-binding Zn-ribbon protein